MSLFSPEELERALVRQGVAPERARATARSSQAPLLAPAPSDVLASITWPVRLLLPWSHLISDNDRHGVIEGKLMLTSRYRRAKGLVRDLARPKLAGCEPASIPLKLEAHVWVPDDNRAHDVCNFAKCAHDALEGIVYTKDRWLHDVRWIRVGVDVDAPRAHITITPAP